MDIISIFVARFFAILKNDKEISCYNLLTGILIKAFSCTHEADRQSYLRQSIVSAAEQKGRSKPHIICCGSEVINHKFL